MKDVQGGWGPPPSAHRSDLLGWVRTPRRSPAPGIYAFGHTPRTRLPEDQLLPVRTLVKALLALIGALFAWSFYWNGYLPIYSVIRWVVPGLMERGSTSYKIITYFIHVTVIALLAWIFGRLGEWLLIWRRLSVPAIRWLRASNARSSQMPKEPPQPPSLWPDLRAAGHESAADRLDADARASQANDVDYVRTRRVWERTRGDTNRLRRFLSAAAAHGLRACPHPSGQRDLPLRVAQHDLLTRQTRIGRATDAAKNPPEHRGAGIALDPSLLGTALVAVGPSGTGKTSSLARPVVEGLCLQALCGSAAVVAVAGPHADLGPDEAFDVIVAPGDPASPYGLDLFGGSADPDEAGVPLADALLPPDSTAPEQPARTALQQLLGPFRAVHGRYPSVPELRHLLDGSGEALNELVEALRAANLASRYGHELRARRRQQARPDDMGQLLADRLARLDRPAFAGAFAAGAPGEAPPTPAEGPGAAPSLPPFAMRALDHPLRIKVVLPERAHPEAARILGRLVIGQFMQAASWRADRSLFACLVVDDASVGVDAEVVRGLQRMRSANAGVVLLLRTLAEIPERLRVPLLGAVGCRMAFPGLDAWDGALFAESWGTVRAVENAVTRTKDTSGGLIRRAIRGARHLWTGQPVQRESVTIREVERPRWSASELAQSLPAGHAVISFTTVGGEQVPPVLVNLRG